MSDVAYHSEVRIKHVKGYLPAEPEPFIFGVRGAVAKHYQIRGTPRHNARLHLSPLRQRRLAVSG